MEALQRLEPCDGKLSCTVPRRAAADNSGGLSGEMEAYDNFERSLDAYNTLLDDREARGEARGIAIGETKGELEGKLKVAKNLKGMGLALDAIQKATDLNA